MKKLLIFLAFCVTTTDAQTIEQVRKELINQSVPHHEIVLAQARLESGNFTSKRSKLHHNILGIKHGKNYARYSRWEDCISDYKKIISSRYKGGDYYAFLTKIGYAEDPNYIRKIKRCLK